MINPGKSKDLNEGRMAWWHMPTMSVFCLGGKDRKVASSRPVGAVPNNKGEERENRWRKKGGRKEGR